MKRATYACRGSSRRHALRIKHSAVSAFSCLALLLACTPPDPTRELLALVEGEVPPPYDGRLTAALGAPEPASVAILTLASPDERAQRWRLAARAAEREVDRLPPARSALQQGILYLAMGRAADAVPQLQAAVARDPSEPHFQNALAVAHLTRGLRQGLALDFPLALAAVDRALQVSPASGALLYNRALILSSFPAPRQAIAAWDAYLAVADDPASITEAQAFKKRLESPDRFSFFHARRRAVESLRGPAKIAAIGSLVADFPYQVRRWAENELLGRWAEAADRRDVIAATETLELIRLIGAAVAAQRGDRMLEDAVRAIDVTPPRTTAWRALVEGHLRFAIGVASYDRQDLEAAEPNLLAAGESLARARSPFAGWADFYRAICVYYGDSEQATALFLQLDSDFPPDRYPVLNGRVHWLLATALGVQGRDQEGLNHNERALRLLSAASGEQEAAFVHVLLAEAYDLLGEVEMGWHHRLRALQGVSGSGDHRRVHSMLNEAAQALLRQGFPVQALTFLEELLANAAEWPDHPIARAEGLTQRSQTLLALDRTDEALEDIRDAQDVLENLAASNLKVWLANWLDLYEGLAYVESDPARAEHLLTTAFERQSSAGYQWDRPRYLAERARALTALGDLEAARADLERAVAIYEQTRARLTEVALKMRYFRLAQPAFEALLISDLEQPGEEERAFVTAERARARFLLDRRLVASGGERDEEPPFPRPRDLAATLPEGTALVEFSALPDQVVGWIVAGESWRVVRLPLQMSEMETLVEQLRQDLQRYASERSVAELAATLYDALIRPLNLGEDITSLILVPDRFLFGLPFSVLYDQQRQRYLVEQYALTLYPSAALLLQGLARRQTRNAEGPLLAVGVNDAGGDLRPLFYAEDEAREIGTLYPHSQVLIGQGATRRSFLGKLTSARIVHIAAHAAANPEVPPRSRLFLMPEDDDGTVTAADLWQLDLSDVELVVLAACESLRGQTDGREAFFGLAGGFLAAGVGSVVGSLWRVDDAATGDLMVAFHRYYRQQPDASHALRRTILDALGGRRAGSRSPGSWAPFVVVGGTVPGKTETETTWRIPE